MCDSLLAVFDSQEVSDGGDGTCRRPRQLWRRAPAKKGRQVLERICMRETTTLRRMARCRAEQVGFARFFDNPKVTVEEILATAGAHTAQGAAGRHVLLIEDTSEINYQAKSGRKSRLGRVGNGTDVGLFVHPALAIDAADGTILGLAGATIWCRYKTKRRDYQEQPIETKESYRWLETITQARAELDQSPLVTAIADREADIYELFARLPEAQTHVLVRAAHNRALGDGGRLFKKLAAQPVVDEIGFELPARPGRPAREVRLAVRFKAVTLRQPRQGADRRDPKIVPLNAVEIREIDPPAKADAVLWRLLTTHRVTTAEDARTIVELYRRRWAVENDQAWRLSRISGGVFGLRERRRQPAPRRRRRADRLQGGDLGRVGVHQLGAAAAGLHHAAA